MTGSMAWLAIWLVQGAAMLVDEAVFHRRRGLGPWERVGHPLDTITVIAPYATAAFLPCEGAAPAFFFGLAAFSCLFVTKDEWVHHRECEATEQWLHSLLFVVHPLGFLSAWKLWTEGPAWPLRAQLGLMAAFFLHQTLYWSLIRREHRR